MIGNNLKESYKDQGRFISVIPDEQITEGSKEGLTHLEREDKRNVKKHTV